MYRLNGIGTALYGQAKPVEFVGADRLAAQQAGYVPQSYQAVKWFTVVFLPVIPLGTYRVIRRTGGFNVGIAASREYSLQSIPWDWGQVARHYVVGYSIPVGFWVLSVLGTMW